MSGVLVAEEDPAAGSCLYTLRWPHRQAATKFMGRIHLDLSGDGDLSGDPDRLDLSGDRDRGVHSSRPADPPAGCVGGYRASDWMRK